MQDAYTTKNGSNTDYDLTAWCDEWLHTKGVNTVKVEKIEGNKVTIAHGNSKNCETLKYQKIDVEIINADDASQSNR